MANKLVSQGTINKLRASIVLTDNPQLNITSPYLTKDGISISLEGESTTVLQTLTGFTTSPEPYQVARITAHLVKAIPLANQWKLQMENTTLIGDFTVRPDAAALSPYQLSNGVISGVSPLSFSGNEASFTITLMGIYYINSNLFN